MIAQSSPKAPRTWTKTQLSLEKVMIPDCMLASSIGADHVHAILESLERTGAHLAEIKWDGLRGLTRIEAGRVVELRGRPSKPHQPGADQRHRFPEIIEALPAILKDHKSIVLDGEIGLLDPTGSMMEFHAVQQRPQTDRDGITLDAIRNPMTYVVFDILEVNGVSTMSHSYEARHALLRKILRPAPRVQFSEVTPRVVDLYERMVRIGGEGIMVKNRHAPYEPCKPGQKSKQWLKAKAGNHRDNLDVVGLTQGTGAREDLGSLILAKKTERGWQYHGRAGSGITHTQIAAILAELSTAQRETCPLVETPEIRKPLRCWIEPGIVKADVAWERAVAEDPRHPRVKGLSIRGLTIQ